MDWPHERIQHFFTKEMNAQDLSQVLEVAYAIIAETALRSPDEVPVTDIPTETVIRTLREFRKALGA